MAAPIGKLVRDARAATAVEYGLILAMICVLGLTGLNAINSRNGSVWGNLVRVLP